jgi:hypothetical protein
MQEQTEALAPELSSVSWNRQNQEQENQGGYLPKGTHKLSLISFFFFFVVLGLELGAFTLSHSASPFCEGFFEIGSCEPFAQAGFELQSS